MTAPRRVVRGPLDCFVAFNNTHEIGGERADFVAFFFDGGIEFGEGFVHCGWG
jgi:hypothetical protein